MKKVNAIDLDKTLIPFDSFRRYIFRLIQFNNAFPVFLLIIQRKLRLMKSVDFKKKIVTLYRKDKNYNKLMLVYATELYESINRHVLEAIDSHTDTQTVNVLVTASPDDYVSELCKILGWRFIASTLQGGEFTHAYGRNKISLLQSSFDPEKYTYNFAISDHESDDELLTLFDKSIKIIGNRLAN